MVCPDRRCERGAMKQQGLEQARERGARVYKALEILKSDAPLAERESAWLDAVQIFGTVYSKLEQAAKGSQQSEKWFAGIRSERKTDPLLKYLHHARNAGEHTIVKAATKAEIAVQGRITKEVGTLGFRLNEFGQLVPFGSGVEDFRVFENEILLQAAFDRGQKYLPPDEHLGQPIESNTAGEVAELMESYLNQLLAAASALPPHS